MLDEVYHSFRLEHQSKSEYAWDMKSKLQDFYIIFLANEPRKTPKTTKLTRYPTIPYNVSIKFSTWYFDKGLDENKSYDTHQSK